MANQYFADHDAAFTIGETLSVSGEEARHAVKVARLRVAERVRLINGNGHWSLTEVTSVKNDSFSAVVLDVGFEPEPEVRLILVQALLKAAKDEDAVRQCTEFGVDEIVAWPAKRSISIWAAEKVTKNLEKWQKVAFEASKQSLRARPPKIVGHKNLKEILAELQEANTKAVVLDPHSSEKLSDSLLQIGPETRALYFFVGPEGGISAEELELLESVNPIRARLGANVLRSVSAGSAALAVASTILKRW